MFCDYDWDDDDIAYEDPVEGTDALLRVSEPDGNVYWEGEPPEAIERVSWERTSKRLRCDGGWEGDDNF